eukprot:jgi/Bigna1/90572/estExt_fgenesh1_pg.C_730084
MAEEGQLPRTHRGSHASRTRSVTITSDVFATSNENFRQMGLSAAVLKGLDAAGFHKPSPIQLEAIPLGRFGKDLIAQIIMVMMTIAILLTVAALLIDVDSKRPQAVTVAPTREIAVQIRDVVCTIGKFLPVICNFFIGGLSVAGDKLKIGTTQIVVSVRTFVLDEADQLLAPEFAVSVAKIASLLPRHKQVMTFSATYTERALILARKLMSKPYMLRLSKDEPSLKGVKQYYMYAISEEDSSSSADDDNVDEEDSEAYSAAPDGNLENDKKKQRKKKKKKKKIIRTTRPHELFAMKVRKVLWVLGNIVFHQCVIFSNFKAQAEELVDILNDNGFPSCCIAGEQQQRERLEAIAKIRAFEARVLVSTDLSSRGVDIERISLVINLDLPSNPNVYLHRVGRTGRFGTRGLAITVVSGEGTKEERRLQNIKRQFNTQIEPLTDTTTSSLMELSKSLLESLGEETDEKQLETMQKVRLEAARRTSQEQAKLRRRNHCHGNGDRSENVIISEKTRTLLRKMMMKKFDSSSSSPAAAAAAALPSSSSSSSKGDQWGGAAGQRVNKASSSSSPPPPPSARLSQERNHRRGGGQPEAYNALFPEVAATAAVAESHTHEQLPSYPSLVSYAKGNGNNYDNKNSHHHQPYHSHEDQFHHYHPSIPFHLLERYRRQTATVGRHLNRHADYQQHNLHHEPQQPLQHETFNPSIIDDPVLSMLANDESPSFARDLWTNALNAAADYRKGRNLRQ